MGHTFDKSQRLLRREGFLAVQREGRKLHAAHLFASVRARGDEGPARLGLVTSRKAGNAVHRNRFRRVMREYFRLHPEMFPVGCDVVIVAREGIPALASATLRDEIAAALSRRRPKGPRGPDEAPAPR